MIDKSVRKGNCYVQVFFLHESEECAIRKRKSRERLHYEAKEEKGNSIPHRTDKINNK